VFGKASGPTEVMSLICQR